MAAGGGADDADPLAAVAIECGLGAQIADAGAYGLAGTAIVLVRFIAAAEKLRRRRAYP